MSRSLRLVLGAVVLSLACEHTPLKIDEGKNQPPGAGPAGGASGSPGATPPSGGSSGGSTTPGTTPGRGLDAGAAPPDPKPPAPPSPPAPGTPGTPPTPGACTMGLEGSETSCKSPAEWKAIAAGICKAKGQELTDYSAGGGDCGNGNTRYVKYECCTPRPTPPPTPPPPSPTSCFGDSQGDGSSCKTDAVWKQYASDACHAKGAELTAIDYADQCGPGMFRFMKYVCCAPTPPTPTPPPPPPLPTTPCTPGRAWCSFSGRCVEARCLDCCDHAVAPVCKTSAECSRSCTKCSNGGEACADGVCGAFEPNRCYFPEPKCPGR